MSPGGGLMDGSAGLMPSGQSTIIMGILNVTPDSFFDGGNFINASAAVRRGEEMIGEGADWIDVGGESSRPGAEPVTAGEESARVIPVIRALVRAGATVSVDTTKAAVAIKALEEGARIVNDISAFSMDPEMAGVCAKYRAISVLMHMRGTPKSMQSDTEYKDLAGEVYGYLEARMEYAVSRGVDRDKIILDPGIGFGKSAEGNVELIRNIPHFKRLGRPLLVGASRKSFIGSLTGGGPGDRLAGSLAVAVAAVLKGADVLRVHDVRETK
ncbi:MAG: dihydropteroate synthase, partial [Thermodesulfobacteriota bacterium]